MTDAGDPYRGILAYPANVNSDGKAWSIRSMLTDSLKN
jgi:hypothetical protein